MLSLITLLCGFASVYLLFVPNKKAPVLAFVVGFILLLGCLWVLAKCLRLITGRKTRGGLLSPRALRVVSFFLLILPVVGLFTGYYREMRASRVLPSGDVLFRISWAPQVGSEARDEWHPTGA